MSSIITKPTFTVDGWTANVIDDDGIDWFCPEHKSWFSPVGVRTFSSPRPVADGDFSDRNYRTPRVITLRGTGKAPTYPLLHQAMDQFNALLSDGELHELVVEEEYRSLRAMVRLSDGTNLEPLSRSDFGFQLVLVSPDPRKYSTVLKAISTGLATPAPGGVQWDGPTGATGLQWNGPTGSTGVQWQSGNGSTGVVTLTNAGTAATPVVFTITATAEDITSPKITVASAGSLQGQTIEYGGVVPAGSVLVIDTESGSVLLDGANRGPLLTQASFFSIPRNSSLDISFSALSSSPTASLLAEWRDAYI